MRRLVALLGFLVLALNCGFLARHFHRDVPVETLKLRYADTASRFVDIDGATVHVKDEGTEIASPVPLVLIHGTGSSLHTWDGWVRAFGAQVRTVRFDLPGFGLTGPNRDDDYRVARYVETLDALLDTLGVDVVDVAGNSLGGHVAWMYALDRPERVRRLVLIDSAGYRTIDGSTTVLEAGRVPLLKTLFRKVTPRSLVEQSLFDVYADDGKVTPPLVERNFQLLLRAGNRDAMIARLNGTWDDREDELSSIRQPTLVLWGARDTWIPPTVGERFVADLPNAELRLYDDAGHVPMEELPEPTAADTLAFLARPDAD